MVRQTLDFAIATAEDERIAAFQTSHCPARFCGGHQPAVDFLLGPMGLLASQPLDQLAGRGNAQVFEKGRRYEPIDQDGVGRPQGMVAAQRDQVGRARTRTDNIDLPGVCRCSPSCVKLAKVRRAALRKSPPNAARCHGGRFAM